MSLVENVAQFCAKHNLLARQDKVVIGVSGGPDSLCLLHVCQKLAARLELSLIVAHLNHQLRPAAQADEDFVRELAKRWQLPIFVEAQNVSRFAQENKHSLEEAARYCRYDFLGRVAAETAAHKVAVGHNADDQVETVLMHFLRGAGLTGLRGMLPGVALSHLNSGQTVTAPHLIRPLLETSRSDIEGYCQRHQLSPRQDDSNLDPTYFRNRLRHELIPYLETYNPNIRQVLQRTAKVVAAEVETLDGLVDQVWPGVIKDSSAESLVFATEVWLALPLALKRATLRRASYTLQKHLRDLSFDHIERAITLIERRQSGRQATLPQGLRLIVSYDSFVLTKAETSLAPAGLNQPYLATPEMLALTVPGLTPLPQTAWQLRAKIIPTTTRPAPAEEANPRWEVFLEATLAAHPLFLRPRQPGDSFCPTGLGGHRKKISDFMIDEKIPARQRPFIPLLVAGEQVVWVCGYRTDERVQPHPESQAMLHLKFELTSDNFSAS